MSKIFIRQRNTVYRRSATKQRDSVFYAKHGIRKGRLFQTGKDNLGLPIFRLVDLIIMSGSVFEYHIYRMRESKILPYRAIIYAYAYELKLYQASAR